ncbi:hypothetical protein EON78_01445 [bacterium]|nr:MAG: hypothetical protein EON78_01445 [bacterium]
MEPTIEELRKNYEKFDDKKLIQIATNEASGLRPEAVDLIKEIIKERGLSENITKAIDAQLQEIDEITLNDYTEILRNLHCPICKLNTYKLNATMTGRVISFIVFTSYEKKLVIGCPDCLEKANKDAMIKTALLGWWGLPWGLIRTPLALLLNNKMRNQSKLSEANDLLKGFALENIGFLEANRHNQKELEEFISNIN